MSVHSVVSGHHQIQAAQGTLGTRDSPHPHPAALGKLALKVSDHFATFSHKPVYCKAHLKENIPKPGFITTFILHPNNFS